MVNSDNDVEGSNGVMTEEEILKKVIGVDDDDLDEDKEEEEEDLEIVHESFQYLTGSVVMSALGTLSIFGMFNDAFVKDVDR